MYKGNDGHWRAAREIFKLNYAYRATAPVHCGQLAGVSENDWTKRAREGRILFSISDRRVGRPLRRLGAEGLSPTRPRSREPSRPPVTRGIFRATVLVCRLTS
jgi:hypothetical protein